MLGVHSGRGRTEEAVVAPDDVDVVEDEPTRFTITVTRGDDVRTASAVVPAGVGVPGATDEVVLEEVVRVLIEQGDEVPDPLDLSALLRERPGLLVQVEGRLDA